MTKDQKQRERREKAAMAVLTGLLSDSNYSVTFEQAARDAVRQADALLAELDKEPSR